MLDKQEEFASTYESRFKQTPAETNSNVVFEGVRGESLCTLKPPPDPTLQKILNEAGINGIEYKNGVPDFSPVAKAQLEIDYMLGGKGAKGNTARDYNFKQANERLADQLNNSPELANQFGMEAGGITAKDIEKYRVKNKLTWHELNDGVTIQLVPTEINVYSRCGHTFTPDPARRPTLTATDPTRRPDDANGNRSSHKHPSEPAPAVKPPDSRTRSRPTQPDGQRTRPPHQPPAIQAMQSAPPGDRLAPTGDRLAPTGGVLSEFAMTALRIYRNA